MTAGDNIKLRISLMALFGSCRSYSLFEISVKHTCGVIPNHINSVIYV